MAKSQGKKKKAKKPKPHRPGQRPSQDHLQVPPTQHLLFWVWRAISISAGLVSLLVSLFAAADFYRASSPSALPSNDSSIDPYVAPYQLRNDSSWFTMYDVVPSCGLADFRAGNVQIQGLTVAVGVQSATILPKHSAIYLCRTDLLGVRPGKTTSAKVIIHGTYVLRLLGHWWAIREGFTSDILNVYVDDDGKAHWLEGEVIE